MTTDRHGLHALDTIEEILQQRAGLALGEGATMMNAAGAGDIDRFCSDYRQIRPLLDTVLIMIRRIPIYGEKIANVIRFLMGIADRACVMAPVEVEELRPAGEE